LYVYVLRAAAKGVIVQYNFEWDPDKQKQNQEKHGVSFEQAATAFKDPRAVSVYDEDHSAAEDRWITLGLSAAGGLFVVHHTYEEVDESTVRIRIISTRKATKHEIEQYQEQKHEEGV